MLKQLKDKIQELENELVKINKDISNYNSTYFFKRRKAIEKVFLLECKNYEENR